MQSLLVIDDKGIRKHAFTRAEKIIKKLDRLTADIEGFRDQDQRLFSCWFELTFREARKKIEDRHDEFRGLGRFHNWIIALSQMRRISLPEAILILRNEEDEYLRGQDQDRRRIDNNRKIREEFIQREMEKEFGRQPDNEPHDNNDEDIEPESHGRTATEEVRFQSMRNMTDKKIRKLCRYEEESFSLLGEALGLTRSNKEHDLFLRIWDLTPHKHQVNFAKIFARQTGDSLKRVIEEMRESMAQANYDKEGHEAEFENDHGFSEDFMGRRPNKQPNIKSAAELETLKILYRKLVRRLHPDLQDCRQSQLHWQKKIWARVQIARNNQNKLELEKLLLLVLIRNRELNDIRVSEIFQIEQWLLEEIKRVGLETQDLKSLPAWGFSRRKDYSPLKRKLEKGVLQELKSIESQISELKSQHEFLELIGRTDAQRPLRRRRRPRPRRAQRNYDQMDLPQF